jgi:hypothetical protein
VFGQYEELADAVCPDLPRSPPGPCPFHQSWQPPPASAAAAALQSLVHAGLPAPPAAATAAASDAPPPMQLLMKSDTVVSPPAHMRVSDLTDPEDGGAGNSLLLAALANAEGAGGERKGSAAGGEAAGGGIRERARSRARTISRGSFSEAPPMFGSGTRPDPSSPAGGLDVLGLVISGSDGFGGSTDDPRAARKGSTARKLSSAAVYLRKGSAVFDAQASRGEWEAMEARGGAPEEEEAPAGRSRSVSNGRAPAEASQRTRSHSGEPGRGRGLSNALPPKLRMNDEYEEIEAAGGIHFPVMD